MARIRYVDPETMPDPEIRGWLDDAWWRQLRGEFSELERVELGYWIGFRFGGRRRLKTLATKQREFEPSPALKKSSVRSDNLAVG